MSTCMCVHKVALYNAFSINVYYMLWNISVSLPRSLCSAGSARRPSTMVPVTDHALRKNTLHRLDSRYTV